MRCSQCGAGRFKTARRAFSREIGGQTYTGEIPGKRCENCGHFTAVGADVTRWERAIAREVIAHGAKTADGLKFIREVSGLQGKKVAELLGVNRVSVSRWEDGARPIDAATWATIGNLTLDALEGRATTADRLRAIQAKLRKRLAVELRPAGA
jgi:hypothetical protein